MFTIGFGRNSVSSRSRAPMPPQKMTTSMILNASLKVYCASHPSADEEGVPFRAGSAPVGRHLPLPAYEGLGGAFTPAAYTSCRYLSTTDCQFIPSAIRRDLLPCSGIREGFLR